MNFYNDTIDNIETHLNSNIKRGLTTQIVIDNRQEFGQNIISKKAKTTIISKIIKTLLEPMMLILLFSLIITFGINFGKFLKSGESDFSECLGIFLAILLSITITLIMEGSSEKAFKKLSSIYQDKKIKVIRDGKICFISNCELVVGDIVLLKAGDKICADGRVVENNSLSLDESALTGESQPMGKNNKPLVGDIPLAERENMVYSGTFVLSGEGKIIITAVGDKTEIGKIASEIKKEKEITSPLQQKLNKLSKTITVIGVCVSVFVLILNFIKLAINGNMTFSNVQELFINCIILIVASIPEGLPTIVAVSLAINMTKLAKENALIKKMIATETAGAVSVICTDKTGTLTTGKMQVEKICYSSSCFLPKNLTDGFLKENFIINSTCEIAVLNNKYEYYGDGTECAILKCIEGEKRERIYELRKKYKIIDRVPFDNKIKMMSTSIEKDDEVIEYIKGAPEIIIKMCDLTDSQKHLENNIISKEQRKARRILCFAHKIKGHTYYDGYVSLIDPIRPEVKKAVKNCFDAGIKIKVLTGDNYLTAFSIAKELEIVDNESEVVSSNEIEKMSDVELKRVLARIKVIARSTPLIKMRVVKLLKEIGEVVAVTGDGINDAPAIKHSDIGIAMGINGSEITKETADIVLLDDSFYTIVKAIFFGRNVYRNLQRFILFQLSVNLSALLFISFTAIFGYNLPFNTLQLLWINVIMDGPPALTLGLDSASSLLMKNKPIKREQSIVTTKMLLKIIFNGVFISTIVCLQYLTNFLYVSESEIMATVFTLFIMFQLFNAFNSRDIGAESIFNLPKNRIMALTFLIVFIIQILITNCFYNLFMISPLSFLSWIKIVLLSSCIIWISEICKFFVRKAKRKNV